MVEQPLEPNVVDTAASPSYRVDGDLVTFKPVAAGTNGSYALFEIRTDPGAGMPPHRQWYDDEARWILEGHYTVRLDNREVRLTAGGYVYLPRGPFTAMPMAAAPRPYAHHREAGRDSRAVLR
jgi:quercetin dioxygenase-like cupin family protein